MHGIKSFNAQQYNTGGNKKQSYYFKLSQFNRTVSYDYV